MVQQVNELYTDDPLLYHKITAAATAVDEVGKESSETDRLNNELEEEEEQKSEVMGTKRWNLKILIICFREAAKERNIPLVWTGVLIRMMKRKEMRGKVEGMKRKEKKVRKSTVRMRGQPVRAVALPIVSTKGERRL